MSTTDRPQAERSLNDVIGPDRPDGPAAAALVGAGIGCLAMGVLTTLDEANKSFDKAINLNSSVGPLSGKTTFTVLIWLVAWVILHFVLRGKAFAIPRALTICLVLTGLGFLLTFPTFFQLFGG